MKKIVAILALSLSTSAIGFTGADLALICNKPDEKNKGMCVGYIRGVIDMRDPKEVCIPRGTALGEAVIRVMVHLPRPQVTLITNPDGELKVVPVETNWQSHFSASDITQLALRFEYPCK